MKNSILILCLFAFTSALSAQNPRIETLGDRQMHTYIYPKGGDSIRFTIVGKNDTVQTTQFHRNGRKAVISWKKDSLVSFDVLGRPTAKLYGLKEDYNQPDSTFSFFSNGRIRTSDTYKNGKKTVKVFAKDGRLIWMNTITNAPSVSFQKMTDGNGKLVQSSKTDTLYEEKMPVFYRYDTSFYQNGRPFRIIKTKNHRPLVEYEYAKDGTLLKTVLPDSLGLIVFKDNVDCYYGLKNAKGDTIVKPRFDRIADVDHLFFAAYVGESAFLLDKKGAPMPLPVDRLGKIIHLSKNHSTEPFQNYEDTEDRLWHYKDKTEPTRYYAFETNGKYGVMTDKLAVVMPPQYFQPTQYFGEASFFLANETHEDSAYKSVVLNRQGELAFPKQLTYATFSDFEDYFNLVPNENFPTPYSLKKNQGRIVLNAQEELDIEVLNKYALGQVSTGLVLPQKFSRIAYVRNTSIFKTEQYKKDFTTSVFNEVHGLFNVRTKRWLLDTSHFVVDNDLEKKSNDLFVIKDIKTKKMGLMDTTGSYILPIAYDTIGIADAKQGMLWVRKDKKYQIADIQKGKAKLHTTKYDFLVGIAFGSYEFDVDESYAYFAAKQKGKWGIVDATDKIIKPFEFDYSYVNTADNPHFILVKDGQAGKYDLSSLPYEADWQQSNTINEEFLQKISSFELIDNPKRVFFTNDAGKVVVPPQYKLVLDNFLNGFCLVEDEKKNKKLVFAETGQLIDYPFNYTVTALDAKSRVMIVSDTLANSIGVVSTDGKLLIPCVNYAATYGDAVQSLFFVKRDTPVVDKQLYLNFHNIYNSRRDTLDEEDVNWQMFDGTGKMLTQKPFRFAIQFRKNVGIGMQDAAFNLYKTDGTILTPFQKNVIARNEATEGSKNNREGVKKLENNPLSSIGSYTNIRRDRELGAYALFYNQGLTPAMILTKADGEILVESGRYDGISQFYGKYALVTAASKVGLIDSFGREIIAPQDLRTYKGHFADSLNLVNAEHDRILKENGYSTIKRVRQPIDFGEFYNTLPNPDSLAITMAQRTTLWNLLLEKTFPQTIMTASDIRIEHLISNMNNQAINNYWAYKAETAYRPVKYVVEDSSYAFVLRSQDLHGANELYFYNFYRKNGRWEDLNINDLLNIQGDKRWQINDLITKKVKALKDQEIDCSNTAAFITTVENRWMFTKTGLDFCFNSTKYGSGLVVIAFTWAELTPFLKMKIY